MRTTLEPGSGTFELRRSWHARESPRPSERSGHRTGSGRRAPEAQTAVRREPALAGVGAESRPAAAQRPPASGIATL
jgi:hypothetical protein